MLRLFLASLVLLLAGVSGKNVTCNMDGKAYPPNWDEPLPDGTARNITWETVNLDEPATTRWAKIVAPRAEGIRNMTGVVMATLSKLLGAEKFNATLAKLDANIEKYTSRMPHDFGAEVLGIAAATDIEPSVIFVYNIFYTILGACTSIVGQDSAGSIWHARNLDVSRRRGAAACVQRARPLRPPALPPAPRSPFRPRPPARTAAQFGLWPAIALKDDNFWKLTLALRPIIVNVQFTRGGSPLFKSTTFGGFVGVHTAMMPGKFALSIDTKFDGNLDLGLLRWIEEPGLLDKDVDVTWFARTLFQDYDGYAPALDALNRTKMIGPGYVILSGVRPGEGAVVTKGAAKELGKDGETIDLWSLSDEIAQNGTYFLLQTNYDRTGPAPPFDDRRDPGVLCMEQLGQAGTNFNGLFNVLSAMPNLNRLTTFSTLMHTETADFEAYRQQCDHPLCPLF